MHHLVHDPVGDIVISDSDMLNFQAALDQQLLDLSAVLASMVGHGDLIQHLRMRKIDSMLAILHVFAYIAGAKYFTNSDHSLSMTVIKSLDTVLEFWEETVYMNLESPDSNE